MAPPVGVIDYRSPPPPPRKAPPLVRVAAACGACIAGAAALGFGGVAVFREGFIWVLLCSLAAGFAIGLAGMASSASAFDSPSRRT